VIQTTEKIFTEFLEGKDLKLTSQRRTILRQAVGANGHFSAEKLLKLSKKADSTISKATVYRTLVLLKESKVLEEQDFGDGRKIYERAEGRKHHDHLICVKCGKIIEFENEPIERLQNSEARKNSFRIVYHSLKLFGFCKSCR
jgi:Fur family ferric uptake transcriptional regulator